jgi:hypothetical protein
MKPDDRPRAEQNKDEGLYQPITGCTTRDTPKKVKSDANTQSVSETEDRDDVRSDGDESVV